MKKYTILQLRRMRATAKEKVFTEYPELRVEFEKAQAEKPEAPTLEEIREQDREYLYNFGEE